MQVKFPALSGEFMAESQPTSSWTFKTYYDRIVAELGVSSTDAKAFVNDGYQMFLNEDNWSFLYETCSPTVTAGDVEIDLPLNFGSIIGKVKSDSGYILNYKTPDILSLHSSRNSSFTGYLYEYSIVPSYSSAGQKWKMQFFPIPSVATILTFRYRLVPNQLTVDGDYLLGGGLHTMTILAAAYAAYERTKNTAQGPRFQAYQIELEKSIRRDRDFRPSLVDSDSNTFIETIQTSGVEIDYL